MPYSGCRRKALLVATREQRIVHLEKAALYVVLSNEVVV